MKTKNTILLAIALVILVTLAGCTTKTPGYNTRLGTQTRLGDNGLGMNNNWDNNMGMNNGLNDGFNNGMNTDLNNNTNLSTSLGNQNTNASELAKRIGSLPEVSTAAVVVSGNKAVVGVRLNGNNTTGTNMNNNMNTNLNNMNTSLTNNNGNLSSALRMKIENMVKDTNRNITSVTVTSDPSMFSEIQTMSNGTNNGGMMNTITNDIDDLIRRITPNSNYNMNNINR